MLLAVLSWRGNPNEQLCCIAELHLCSLCSFASGDFAWQPHGGPRSCREQLHRVAGDQGHPVQQLLQGLCLAVPANRAATEPHTLTGAGRLLTSTCILMLGCSWVLS